MRTCVISLLALMLCTGLAWSVPSFTPVMDGTKDTGWGNTPDEATYTTMEPVAFNFNNGLYVTDDGQFVYFGFDAPADPWDDGAAIHAHIEIDVGGTAGGGIGDGWGSQVTYSFPYQPEYDVNTQWNTGHPTIDWTGLEAWNGSGWDQTQIPFEQLAGGSGSWTEIAVRRSAIGNPGQGIVLHLSMWARPAWNKNNASCCVPAEAGFPSDFGDGSGHAFHNQFAYSIQSLSQDLIAPQLASVHQIDLRGVELTFNEPMNQATLNQIGNYTCTGWITTGFRYVTSTTVGLFAAVNFTPGTAYSVSLGAGIHDLAGNSIDPAYNSATWNGVGYANVTVTVTDESSLQDTIYFKGSFNFYHEYDASWSGGHQLMYDDGTHGDPVALDHQFTLIWPLVPNGGSPNFEWGLEDEHANWLIVGPNPNFSLPNTDPIAVSYAIPDATHSPVTVIFNLDMQFVTGNVTGAGLAGTMNGWAGQSMSDPDADGVWTVAVLFPTGSQRNQEFKFQRMDGANVEWEFVANRTFQINDAQPNQTLPTYYFNDFLPTPTITAYSAVSGGGLELRWENWPRVHFTVFNGNTPDDINSVVATFQGNVYEVAGPLDAKKFYVVKITE